jgi:hypothetical protein
MFKKLVLNFSSSILMMSPLSVLAQTTVTFQPAGNVGKDAHLASCVTCGYNDNNYQNSDEISASAWTSGGSSANSRGLLEFDLTSIPANATVTSAYLSLYHNPNPATGNIGGQHSTLSGSNEALIKRITSAWSESSVTWDTQPSTTSTGQVLLSQSTSPTQNYLDIDVSGMVQDMVTNPSQNFGFLLQLVNESPYRGLIFASSDHPNSNLRPKLEVCYTLENAGVKDDLFDESGLLKVYPNPNDGNFAISLPDVLNNADLYILDMEGKVVYKDEFTGKELTLNIDLSSGVYFVKIVAADHFFTNKLIVE